MTAVKSVAVLDAHFLKDITWLSLRCSWWVLFFSFVTFHTLSEHSI